MSQLARATQKLFGSTAPSGEIGKFGSFAAGTPVSTTDPATIQALSNFLDGWFSAVLTDNAPAMEDMNALFFLAFRQIAYIFQAGVSEWDSGTTYYIGSMVNSSGAIYVSLTDSNLGNAVTDTTNWRNLARRDNVKKKTSGYTILSTDDRILADASSGGFSLTLPAATGTGKVYKIKKIDSTIGVITFVPNGSDTFEGESTLTLNDPGSIVELVDGESGKWYVF